MPYMTASTFLGLGRQSAHGTPVAPTVYLPCETPDTDPRVTWLTDEGLRGSPVELYGEQPGVQWAEISVKGKAFPDTFQILARAELGGVDTVTGTGPYVHTQKLLNSASTGSQPPEWTVVDYDGTDYARQIGDARTDNLDITFGADQAVEWSTKFVGNPIADIAKPTQSFGTELFVPSWNASLSIAGSPVDVLENGELNLSRGTAPIHTMQGTDAPYQAFAGPLAVSGKFTYVYEAGNSVLADGTSRATKVVVLTLTEPVSGHSIAFTMSKLQYTDPKINRGNNYVAVDTSFMAEANTTDASSGYSPIKIVTTNGVSTAA